MNELLDIIRETIERGDFDQAANHCGILLEHLMQAGATDATLARSIGRLEDVKHHRAKQRPDIIKVTLRDVEAGIAERGIVDLGGGMTFPADATYEQAYLLLLKVDQATGLRLKRGKFAMLPALFVYPRGDWGHWRVAWHDQGFEITRFEPETRRFQREGKQ